MRIKILPTHSTFFLHTADNFYYAGIVKSELISWGWHIGRRCTCPFLESAWKGHPAWRSHELEHYQTANDIVRSTHPGDPVLCLRPAAARQAAAWFRTNFPGKTFYAVKANPAPWLLNALIAGGIDHFDVASIKEARAVRRLARSATLGFMHPVKSAEAVREAYHNLGIRIFSLDSLDELDKIVHATEDARDLTLCVRLAVASHHSKISLATKFGATDDEDAELLGRTRQVAERLGLCFHVGSQSMSPDAFAAAMDQAQRAIVRSGVIVDILDVGGGFPSVYPGMMPPPLARYIDEIAYRADAMLTTENCELWCEPGRAVAAEAASLIVRVERRRGDTLYINDGVYGALFDAGSLGWTYPVRQLDTRRPSTVLAPFSFYGPTCDDYDHMRGPFMLPETIQTGDYIEIGMLGAYGAAMRTAFNGFDTHLEYVVNDPPMLTQFATLDTSVAYENRPVAARANLGEDY